MACEKDTALDLLAHFFDSVLQAGAVVGGVTGARGSE
jgi:hypothetical protein